MDGVYLIVSGEFEVLQKKIKNEQKKTVQLLQGSGPTTLSQLIRSKSSKLMLSLDSINY